MKIYTFLALLLLTFLVSCTEIIDIDLGEQQTIYLCVDGKITTEKKAHKVELKWSADYFESNILPPVNKATVTISDGEQIFELTEKDTTGFYYTADTVCGEVGKTYTLTVVTDSSIYTADCYLKEVPEIDTVRVKIILPGNYNYMYNQDTLITLSLSATEPQTKGDVYMWDYYINGELQSDTITQKALETDDFVNNQYIEDIDIYWLDKYEIPDWDIYKNKIELFQNITTIELSMASIPRGYYEFFFGIINETLIQGSPFAGPPANVSTNLSEGAIGYFLASDIVYKQATEIEIVVPPPLPKN